MNPTHTLVIVTADGERRYMRTLGVGTELEMSQLAHSLDVELDSRYIMLIDPIKGELAEYMKAPMIEGVTLDGEPVARR